MRELLHLLFWSSPITGISQELTGAVVFPREKKRDEKTPEHLKTGADLRSQSLH